MSNMIVNIRGGSGSGKTTVVRKFLEFPHETLWGKRVDRDKQEVKGYMVDCSAVGLLCPIYVIGSYETQCGGTDSVNTQQEIGDRIEQAFNSGGHVLVEGLLMSKSGPGGHLSPRMRDLGGRMMWFGFLNTPADTCVERVLQRRKDAGNHAPFDDNKTVRPGHKQANKSKVLLDREGDYNTCWLQYDDEPHLEVFKMLQWAETM